VSSRGENLKNPETAEESWKAALLVKLQKRKKIATIGENWKKTEKLFQRLPASQPTLQLNKFN
jgi:hypothetical protein